MSDSLQHAVCDVLDLLLVLERDGIRPGEARARLQPLRSRHSGLGLDLLAEEQAYDHSVHYDVLVRRPGEGTVSLSYCPERAVPWPLRGVHRWSEGDLVHVNAHVLQVDQAMACLDFIWDEAPIIERLVDMCLAQEELDRQPIDLTDDELQQAMDRFRSAKKLFKAEDTLRWLERHGMSHEKLERYVAESVMIPKLRDRITAGRVDEYFSKHSADFDSVLIARLDVPDENQARNLARQIREGTLQFFAAAERCFFEAVERSAQPAAALFDVILRRDAAPDLREQLFAASPGQLIGPVRIENSHVLMLVRAVVPARLDARTGAAIKNILFKEWLAERRRAARIEWCWGNAAKTPV